jgi:hypothetical protein
MSALRAAATVDVFAVTNHLCDPAAWTLPGVEACPVIGGRANEAVDASTGTGSRHAARRATCRAQQLSTPRCVSPTPTGHGRS